VLLTKVHICRAVILQPDNSVTSFSVTTLSVMEDKFLTYKKQSQDVHIHRHGSESHHWSPILQIGGRGEEDKHSREKTHFVGHTAYFVAKRTHFLPPNTLLSSTTELQMAQARTLTGIE
jgi:hypothetical protein